MTANQVTREHEKMPASPRPRAATSGAGAPIDRVSLGDRGPEAETTKKIAKVVAVEVKV